jgi:hypothetical protein
VHPPEPKPFAWHLDVIDQVERLLTLLFGHAVQSTSIRLSRDGESHNDSRTDTSLFFSRRRLDQPALDRSDFLTSYPELESVFPRMLRAWLTEAFDIRHALNLIFSSIREPGAFLETRFLPIVQAAEVFGRAVIPGRVVSETEFRRLRRSVVKSIPKEAPREIRKAITDKLAFANELSLAQRLLALIDQLEANTVSLFCKDRNQFVRGIVDTRNFLTHYTYRYKRILQKGEMHWATVKLMGMLRILILKRLGVPEAQIQAILRRHHRVTLEIKEWENVSELGSPLEKKGD